MAARLEYTPEHHQFRELVRDFVRRSVVPKHETWERDGKMVGASLKAGDVDMLLNQDDGAKGWDRVKGEGFSMMLTTTMDIDRYAADIKSRGGVLETEPADMPWGARVFRLKDPDGFKLVISKENG